MNKRANNGTFLAKIVIAIALVAILGTVLWGYFGQDTVAVQSAKDAYAQYISENPGAAGADFIYVWEDNIIIAIRNGKIIRKEYATEADAVKAALGSKDGANYSLAGTGNGKLFSVKLFEKTDDIYALGTSTLAAGADKLSIKVVSNGMIFATFDIPAEAIDRKESPVGITIKQIDPEDNVKLGKNEKGFAYDIDVTNLVENNTARIAVTMNGPKGLVAGTKKTAITVYHKDKTIASAYDPVSGQISFETANFSPFTCTYEEIPVSTLEELRYYLQRSGSANIVLQSNIVIDLANGDREGEGNTSKTYDKNGESVYYAKGYYYDEWLYFGAIVSGEKALNLNGKTITYTGDVTKNDNALFCVDGKTFFAIYDNSETKGAIEVKFDHYAVWSVENTSSVSIYDGIFVSDKYTGIESVAPNRALVYSSGGEINVYGGYFLYENTNEGKVNGGFNVLDEITTPRIWIHTGAFLSEPVYRQNAGNDNNTVVLVGGTSLALQENTTIYDVTKWYTVGGQSVPVKLTHTDKILYRVGNLNNIPLSALFDVTDFSNYSVRIVDIVGTDIHNANLEKNFASGSTYYQNLGDVTLDGIYSSGNINFANSTATKGFTGPIRVELYDATSNAIHAQIFLEVVDGKNMTTSAISPNSTNKNACMLSDITLTAKNAISVSGGYALYGNGFTITDGRLGTTDNTKDKNGIVYINNGTVENVQVMGYQFTSAGKVLNNNSGHAPAVYINGNANIYNSYIYGGSSPIMVNSATVLLDNVTLDGGAFCNMYLWGAGDVTLKDCTTTTDTHNGPVAMGIVVNNQNAKLKIEGDFNQHNWLTLSQIPGDYQDVLESLYSEADYAYTYGGNTYVNMGVLFVDAEGASFAFTKDVAEGMVTDVSSNAGKYAFKPKTYVITATCYLPYSKYATPEMLEAPAAYLPDSYRVNKPTFSYDNSANNVAYVDDQTPYCTYTNGAINVGTKSDTITLDLSGMIMKWYGRNVSYTWSVSPAATVSGSTVTLSSANTNYTVTINVELISRTSNGEPDETVDAETFTSTLPINISKLSYPKPEWNGVSANGTLHFWIKAGSTWDPDWQEAIPIYNGIKVKFYDTTGALKTVDLSTQTVQPTVSSDNAYATVTFTSGDLAGCTLKITTGFSGFSFKECHYSTSDTTKRMYLYRTTAVNNKPTSGSKALTYTFTDPNGQTTTSTVTLTYNVNSSDPSKEVSLSNFNKGGETSSGGGSNPCVTPDTLVTLADGSKKEIQYVTYADQLLVWNFYEGRYDVMPASIVMNHGYDNYQVVTLNFADGTTVNTINGHGFFDVGECKYVILSNNNAADYIGHEFVKVDGNGYSTTKLVSYSVKTEYTESWSILTAGHYNCILEDMWTVTPAEVEGSPDYLMPFVVGADMKYDAAKLQADIEKYGLYTYEDFAGLMTQQQYEALGLSTWKIAVGKGYITWEDILYLISIHIG